MPQLLFIHPDSIPVFLRSGPVTSGRNPYLGKDKQGADRGPLLAIFTLILKSVCVWQMIDIPSGGLKKKKSIPTAPRQSETCHVAADSEIMTSSEQASILFPPFHERAQAAWECAALLSFFWNVYLDVAASRSSGHLNMSVKQARRHTHGDIRWRFP